MRAEKRALTLALLFQGVLILLFAVQIFLDLPPEDRHTIIWAFPTGFIIFIVGLFILKNAQFYEWVEAKLEKAAHSLGISALQMSLLITSPLYAILAIDAAGFWVKMRSPYVAVIAWLLGITFALWGGWDFCERKPGLSKSTLFWSIAMIILAFLFRGFGTGKIPILLTGDEASAGVTALEFARGTWNNPFITGWFSFPSLFSVIQSLGIRVFGNTVAALRVPSAFIGALTVGALYLCGRAMFGPPRTGLFAAAILATSHYHIHFSRLGLNNIWDGLWFTITIGALWYGWQTKLRWAYLLAGIGLGFSQYFYASSKALIGIIFVAGLCAYCVQRVRFQEAYPHLLAALLVTLTIVIPLAVYYRAEPNALLAPFARVSILSGSPETNNSFASLAFTQVANSWGAYTHVRLADWYTPGSPLLRPLAATFFYIGLIALLFQDRGSRLFFLLAWLMAFAFVNALSSHFTAAAQRYVASAPACALAAGYGLHKMAEAVGGLWRRLRNIITSAAYLVLITIMVGDLSFYFFTYTPSTFFEELASNGMIAYQFANYLRDEPADTLVVFMPSSRLSASAAPIFYLAPQIHSLDAPEAWDNFDQSRLQGRKIIFAFLTENRDKIKFVERDFPGGVTDSIKTWNNEILIWLYEYDQH